MQKHLGIMRAILLAAALVFSAAGTACIHRARVHDEYYNDYHRWDNDEVDHYHQWARETHRDPDRDFHKLPQEEQQEYWQWRHNHDDKRHKHH